MSAAREAGARGQPADATVGRPWALVGGRLVLPESVLEGRALLLGGGRIEAVTPAGDLGADVERIDVAGAYVTPGLIDIHTHGALQRSFLGGDEEAFAVVLAEQARHGVTGVLATTSTAPLELILRTLERTRAWRERTLGAVAGGAMGAAAGNMNDSAQGDDGISDGAGDPASGPACRDARLAARLLGAHVEGPYFAAAQAGAQDPGNLRTPDDGSATALLAYADVIRILSFAPELPGTQALTRALVAHGIVAAAGHSQATDSELAACEAWGLRHVIHLWSGQSTTVRDGPWRRPGLLEATLASDGLTAEVIADGKHLPPTLLRLAYKALGPDRLCLVSDATSGAGLPDGARFTMGAMAYEVEDGVGMMLDRSGFAGSTTFLDGMLRVMTEGAGVPLAEAVRMASLTPARVIGVDERFGSVAPGKDADLALFEPDLRHRCTLIGGCVAAGTITKGVPS